MTKDIKEAVEKCEICAAFQAKNVKQPLQTHEIPDRPWSRVLTDLFTLNCKEYIVLAGQLLRFHRSWRVERHNRELHHRVSQRAV